ncbi:MAG TPA: rhodanese-like domain-containing protein, partial [Thermoanaerobaculia bacterium]
GLDLARLDALVDARRVFDLRRVEPESLDARIPEVDAVPPGAAVIDLRSANAFRSWHYPGALHLDLPHALSAFPAFARDRLYVLVCEVGLKSAHLAEKMREAGFEAFQLRHGIKGLMELAEREGAVAAALLAPAVRD